MSLFKRNTGRRRHVGRRVVGIGAGVALMVVGLAAPAFAAPTIASFAPLSGPVGCVTVVTGTGFLSPVVNDVEFNNVNADSFTIVSDTEIWATVPTTTSGPIEVTNTAAQSVTSPTSFTVTTGTGTTLAGGCAPTITSFTPTCGAAGTNVTITGTNLLRDDGTAGVAGIVGSRVQFAPYMTPATHTVGGVSETATTNQVIVTDDAADGPIRVNTWNNTTTEGAVLSTTSFLVPPPDCAAGGVGHERAITLKLKKNGQASGVVSSTEDPPFDDCVAAVPVKIQRKGKGGGWKNAGSTTTTDTGSYTKKTKGKPGKYRALAPKVAGTTAADDCSKAKSATRTIKK